jgi:hypothetical protein
MKDDNLSTSITTGLLKLAARLDALFTISVLDYSTREVHVGGQRV